jgi:hypothetical protein
VRTVVKIVITKKEYLVNDCGLIAKKKFIANNTKTTKSAKKEEKKIDFLIFFPINNKLKIISTTSVKKAIFLLKTNRRPPVLDTSINIMIIFKNLIFIFSIP